MTYRFLFRVIFFTLALTLVLFRVSTAAAQEAPVLLTIHPADGSEPVKLKDDDLMAMEQEAFVTSTLWTKGTNEFSGPSLHDVLTQAGAREPFAIKLVAANDYSAPIGPELIDETYPIIANRIDGKRFSIREKGPLWIMYPFDAGTGYKREVNYSASVWQLTEIWMTGPDQDMSDAN
ncbi:MAG: oxidoreductase [Roseovarius sp.]|nr:oxidoreductase [Roseovarius sp.]